MPHSRLVTQCSTRPDAFAYTVPVLVVGAGGTGLCAALAAAEAGATVLLIERDATPSGSTAMSTGLIPAAGTPEQVAAGIADSPALFLSDIMRKTHGRADPVLATLLASESADTVSWLRDRHHVPLALAKGWTYPGHSVERMVGTPHRTGTELMAALETAVAAMDIPVLTDARVTTVHTEDAGIVGVSIERPDGSSEAIGCDALVLACSGFGADPSLVAALISEMADAPYYGHAGNRGDALRWGQAMGAAVADLSGYQGHGGLAVGHGVPILWPLIMAGGIQVNASGQRFSNEAAGYSEQAARVNAQPGRIAWSIWDERRHGMMLQFDDYRSALAAGAVVACDTIARLAQLIRVPETTLAATLRDTADLARGGSCDIFGRDFAGTHPLSPPYRASRVTGALFHTQGGLRVDGEARVLKIDGTPFANLFAGGGAARGISGPAADGYLAGNGLLAATTLGKLAGRAAARLVCVPLPA